MSSSTDTKVENPGMVTSDSLAGESIKQGGSFAEDSNSRGPMDQPSRSVNTNTTDTSNATQLDAAPDRPSRDDDQTSDTLLSSGNDGSGRGSGSGQGGSNVTSGIEDRYQPKGNNLTEGGFDSGAPNASFTTDIGGKNDPGRVALEQFGADNAVNTNDASVRDQQISGDNSFEPLGGNTSA